MAYMLKQYWLHAAFFCVHNMHSPNPDSYEDLQSALVLNNEEQGILSSCMGSGWDEVHFPMAALRVLCFPLVVRKVLMTHTSVLGTAEQCWHSISAGSPTFPPIKWLPWRNHYLCWSAASWEVAGHCLLTGSREKTFSSCLLVFMQTFVFALVNCLISTYESFFIVFSFPCPGKRVG